MKKAELIFTFGAVIAIIFRFLQFPRSSVFLLLSVLALAMLYYPLGFMMLNDIKIRGLFKKKSYEGKSIFRLVGSGLAGGAMSVTVIGFLFKFQTYPGSQPMLLLGLGGLVMVLLVSLFKYLRGKDSFYFQILKRVFIIGGLSLVFMMMPNRAWIGWKYPDDPNYAVALANAVDGSYSEELWEIE